MVSAPNYYEILQVSPNADEEIIQAAYRRLAQKWHPDKNPGDPFAYERMRLLNEAYETLSDPKRRREYDARRGKLRNEGPQAEPRQGEQESTQTPDPSTPPPSGEASPERESAAKKAAEEPDSWHWHVALLLSVITIVILKNVVGLGGFLALFIGMAFGKAIALILVPQPKGEQPDFARGIWGSDSQQSRYWFGVAGIGVIVVVTFILGVAAFNTSQPRTETPQPAAAERAPAAAPAAKLHSEPINSMTDWSQLQPRVPAPVADVSPRRVGEAAESIGLGFMHAKKYDKAIEYFDQAVKFDPEYASAYYFRGFTKAQMKSYDEAIKDYDAAIRLDPFTQYYYSRRGEAWLQKKEYDDAIKDCTEAIRLDPRNAFAYSLRGKAWYGKKDYAKARQDFDEAHRLDPLNYE